MRIWREHTGNRTYHRFAGRALILGLVLMLLTGSVSMAEEATVLKALYNPDVPPPCMEQHEPEGDEYFADAVFIGDSMMEYVELLGEIPTANFVWQIGMSPLSVGRKQFRVKDSEVRLTTYEKAAEYAPRKIYILLGSNGLDWNTAEMVISDYEKVADALITYFPEALIYVISEPPMSKYKMTVERTIPSGRYAAFSEQLRALAERRNFYFLDLYPLLVGEDGYLPGMYDSGDGYHLSTLAYQILVDLVRRSTVPYPAAEQ